MKNETKRCEAEATKAVSLDKFLWCRWYCLVSASLVFWRQNINYFLNTSIFFFILQIYIFTRFQHQLFIYLHLRACRRCWLRCSAGGDADDNNSSNKIIMTLSAKETCNFYYSQGGNRENTYWRFALFKEFVEIVILDSFLEVATWSSEVQTNIICISSVERQARENDEWEWLPNTYTIEYALMSSVKEKACASEDKSQQIYSMQKVNMEKASY